MATTGGFVTVQWTRSDTATVTITGPGVFDPTSPEDITETTEFETTTSGTYTVSVSHLGREIHNATIILQGGAHYIINAEPSLSELHDAVVPVASTTAALAAVGDAINTSAKYAGKMVWNATTGIPVWADGPLAADTWSGADGAVDHTPV